MAARIRRMFQSFVERKKGEDFEEASIGGMSLDISKSYTLEQRLEKRQSLKKEIARKLPSKAELIIPDVKRRLYTVDEGIATICAPYLRAIDFPHYTDILSAWRIFYTYTLKFLGDAENQAVSRIIDALPLIHRAADFFFQETAPRALHIMNVAYRGPDVVPERILATYQPPQVTYPQGTSPFQSGGKTLGEQND